MCFLADEIGNMFVDMRANTSSNTSKEIEFFQKMVTISKQKYYEQQGVNVVFSSIDDQYAIPPLERFYIAPHADETLNVANATGDIPAANVSSGLTLPENVANEAVSLVVPELISNPVADGNVPLVVVEAVSEASTPKENVAAANVKAQESELVKKPVVLTVAVEAVSEASTSNENVVAADVKAMVQEGELVKKSSVSEGNVPEHVAEAVPSHSEANVVAVSIAGEAVGQANVRDRSASRRALIATLEQDHHLLQMLHVFLADCESVIKTANGNCVCFVF